MREDQTDEVELEGPGEAVWHVAIAQGQTQGPYTTEELAGLRLEGSIQDAMLVWRDGWTDWRPLGEVGEIVEARPLDLSAVQADAAGSNGFDVSVSMGDDPFGGQGGAFASAGTRESPVPMGDDPFATAEALAQSPRVSAAEAATPGEHREGTVEIDLAGFRRLSTSSTTTTTGLAQATSATREDSGLIDVRKAQAATEAGMTSPVVQVIGIPTGPGLKPPRRPMEFRSKIMLGVGGFAGLCMLVVVAVALMRGSADELAQAPSPEASASAAPPAPTPGRAVERAEPPAPAKDTPAANDTRAAEAEQASADETASDERAEEGEEDDEREVRKGRKGKRSRRSARAPSTRTANPTREPAAKTSGDNSIDDLLGRALEGGGKRPAAKEADSASSSLADTPNRAQVMSAMNGVKDKVERCGDDGVATAKITVKGSTGNVTNVSASGVSGSVKSCVERAVKSARFPKFKQATFSVSYPFRL